MAGNDAVFLTLVLTCILCVAQVVVLILVVICEEIKLKEIMLGLLACNL